MKYGKKILSVFLLVIMVVSMLPINSYAANDEGIYLTWYGSKNIEIGDSLYLYVHNENVLSELYDNEDCTWSSSNTSVATVDYRGKVTGISFGKTTITATTKDGKYSATCDITIKCSEVVIEDSMVRIDVGEIHILRVACPIDDTLMGAYDYDTIILDESIADCRSDGIERYSDEGFKVYSYRIIGKSEGTTTFSVESHDTWQKYTCQIIVGDSTPTPTPTPDPTPTPTPTPSSGTMDMYRLYNPYTGEHLYTSGTFEKDSLVSMGWNYEGVAWKAPETGNAVYRLYNPYSGEHHYTMNTSEKDYLVLIGWNDEGIGWYSSTLLVSVPVYRLFNPNSTGIGAHHYTTDSVERDHLVLAGWQDEGYAWYGQR